MAIDSRVTLTGGARTEQGCVVFLSVSQHEDVTREIHSDSKGGVKAARGEVCRTFGWKVNTQPQPPGPHRGPWSDCRLLFDGLIEEIPNLGHFPLDAERN
jgi:hypothetical protein